MRTSLRTSFLVCLSPAARPQGNVTFRNAIKLNFKYAIIFPSERNWKQAYLLLNPHIRGWTRNHLGVSVYYRRALKLIHCSASSKSSTHLWGRSCWPQSTQMKTDMGIKPFFCITASSPLLCFITVSLYNAFRVYGLPETCWWRLNNNLNSFDMVYISKPNGTLACLAALHCIYIPKRPMKDP